MSEYQYYEFQAIDRPLDRTAQEALRSISSRARITATSFTNHYEAWCLSQRRDAAGSSETTPHLWIERNPATGTQHLKMPLPPPENRKTVGRRAGRPCGGTAQQREIEAGSDYR
jgi:hypothetical protein